MEAIERILWNTYRGVVRGQGGRCDMGAPVSQPKTSPARAGGVTISAVGSSRVQVRGDSVSDRPKVMLVAITILNGAVCAQDDVLDVALASHLTAAADGCGPRLMDT